jgi:hypothetical protein
MVGVAKTILIAIFAGVVFIIVLQVAFFFPFYMTMVVEAFNMSNIAANDNYIKKAYYDDAIGKLRDRPMFSKNKGTVNEAQILAVHDNESPPNNYAIEPSPGYDERFYNSDEGPTVAGVIKPYRQRGNTITVTVKAWYPLRMTLWGNEVAPVNIPVSFSMTTTTLKYYKDLDLN